MVGTILVYHSSYIINNKNKETEIETLYKLTEKDVKIILRKIIKLVKNITKMKFYFKIKFTSKNVIRNKLCIFNTEIQEIS